MRALLRKPAVHVIILGLIGAAAVLIAKGPPVTDASKRVVITGADLLQKRAAFLRTWQREPTAEELRGAHEKHIRQEVLYREALARGVVVGTSQGPGVRGYFERRDARRPVRGLHQTLDCPRHNSVRLCR